MPTFIGKPIPRREDLRLLRGRGRYADDVDLPGALHAVFLRSPHAHARIANIVIAEALAAPGVKAILAGAHYRADGLHGIAHLPNSNDALDVSKRAFVAEPGKHIADIAQMPLACDRVRHVGEIVALVLADTLAQARDAAERIEIAYEPLPAVVTIEAALAPAAPLLYDAVPDNTALDIAFGDRAAVERAFAEAALVIRHRFHNPRVIACPLEPRAAHASYDAATGAHVLLCGSQGAHRIRMGVAGALGVPQEKVEVVTQDVGGGFGQKTTVYPEYIALCWAAKRVGRAVRWTSERGEAFLADHQGRDVVTRAALALDAEGRLLALDLDHLGNVGAHTVSYVALGNLYRAASTIYRVPALHQRVRAVLTNTAPTAPYRGAGRPEAHFVIERLLDLAARKLNIDRIALRRRNLIPRAALPEMSATGITFDSGDFIGNMERAAARADWPGFPERRAEARSRGKLRGIAVANYVGIPVGAPMEKVEIAVGDRGIELRVGTQSTGQGHETSFAQVAAQWLGVKLEEVTLVTGDTRRVGSGGGTHSDRSMRLAGALMVEAAEKVIAKGKAAAAFILGAGPGSVEFSDGIFRASGTNRGIGLLDLARALAERADLPEALNGPLAAGAEIFGRIPAFPTGAGIGEIELDPETGAVAVVRYISVDDVGQVVNPMIVEGQIHGSIAQGLSQALGERFAIDEASGQVLSGSFMDYALIRAGDVPFFATDFVEDPTMRPDNVLRVKGGGEAGVNPAPPILVNAVLDALAELGVEDLPIPATPQTVWAAIKAAKTS
ncbi:MAG TPA: xanthine dehydrogenase family protein molybdopterin-binding subunit [Stellaceae bacterium]|nr:xanthine dehydrogenase family protein molybdopterin-binding subunit [Stellaceae bacterium]